MSPQAKREKELEATVESLKKSNEELRKTESEREAAIETFIKTLSEISTNLEIIKQKENIISMATIDVEMNPVEIERISSDILLINDLLDLNRRTLSDLNKELMNSVIYSEELQKVIDNFSIIVNQQEIEIAHLHDQLKKMNNTFVILQTVIDSLNEASHRQLEKIKEQEKLINTGYYISGNAGQLSVLDIVSPAGGILGIGTVYLLNEDFDKSEFTEIDIYETKKIPLNCQHAKLLSVHPSYSYKFDGPSNYINNLIITRPREFWSNTKYLIILKK